MLAKGAVPGQFLSSGGDMSPNNQLNSQYSILIVDDDAAFLESTQRALLANGSANVTTLQDSSRVLQLLSSGDYSVLLLDWVMPDPSGADLLPEIIRKHPNILIIIISGVSDLENVVNCVRQGAYDYVTKPLDTTRLVSIVNNAVKNNELATRNRRLTDYLLGEPLCNPGKFSEIITCSRRMTSIFKVIEALANSREPLLITGETGVGKELVAKAIHRCSGLQGEMVSVNVAGLDDTMFSDTLFGHKKGAFTGATESREGFIEKAKNSTLFLDEIGDLNNVSQVKLLRLLQQNEFHRLGSDVLHKCEARIIAASNGDFEGLLAAKTFRSDLYYRISAHTIHIPPLRERREDIIPIALHYVKKSADAQQKKPPGISREVKQALLSYHFPGNVRELINMIQNAVTYNRTGKLVLGDFPGFPDVSTSRSDLIRRIGNNQHSLHAIFKKFPTLHEVESMIIEEAMALSKGNKSTAAKMLGVSRPTLHKKLDEIAEGQFEDQV